MPSGVEPPLIPPFGTPLRTASTCFYHLRRLRQLRGHVDMETMKQLISAFICSRLDYCNAVLYVLPQSTISPLQRVQNTAARVVLGLSPRDHVRPALKELHWLPVIHLIQYKVALLMLTVHSNHCSLYPRQSVASVRSEPARQRLRSATGSVYMDGSTDQNQVWRSSFLCRRS